ncbi:MAG: hypothetical protein P4L86_15900 [Mycobacterium sp.]|nr:hypothetical protein [Mycobacterium sp.]
MTTTLLAIAWVVTLVIAALVAVPSKMISDELRARVDDLPVLFVRLALRQLPEDMRAYYEPDWMGNALAAFNDETAKYPVSRFVRSFRFGFSLLVGARQIRKETKVVRQLAMNDENMERPPPSYAMIGPIQLRLRKADGTLVPIEPIQSDLDKMASELWLGRIREIASEIKRPEDWTCERWQRLKALKALVDID